MAKKKKGKPTKGAAWHKKKAITLAKALARRRDGDICQRCGASSRTKQMHGSHVYGTGAVPFLAADLNNIKCLCYHCHFYWWHSNIPEASEWFSEKFPRRRDYLKEKIKNYSPMNKIDWEKTHNDLKEVEEQMKEAWD